MSKLNGEDIVAELLNMDANMHIGLLKRKTLCFLDMLLPIFRR